MAPVKTVGVAEARARLSELLAEVASVGETIIVKRRGKAMAALVPVHDLKGTEGAAEADWLDAVVGLCANRPELCDALDRIVAERQTERE